MDLPEISKEKSVAKWLAVRGRTGRRWIAASILLGSMGGLLLVAQAYCIAAVIHGAFMQGRQLAQMGSLLAALAVVFGGRAIIAWGRERAGFAAGAAVRRQVREEMMARLADLGPVAGAGRTTGAVVAAAMEQVEALQAYFAAYRPQVFLAGIIPATVAAFVFPHSWAAGGILLVTAPLIPLFMILVGMGAESISQRHFQALARMSAHFLDTLQGLATLKIFDHSKKEAENVARVSARYRRKTMAVLRIAFLSSAVLEFFSSVAIAIVAVYLGLRYLGYIEFGSYGVPLTFQQGFFILLLAPEFYSPLKELGAHYHARAGALGAAEEILKILGSDGGTDRARRLKALPVTDGGVGFYLENVSVDFGRGRPALAQVDLGIDPGEKVAVIGPSGAGKSTLINLLLGFVEPTSGQLWINGVPWADIALSSRRELLAWIGQHPILFPGTIFDNISLADPAADEERVRRAASAAGVLEFCAPLPSGIHTTVGEKGLGLSKGQAQRVALARAYLKQAPVLLLDEPTAGLDEETERRLIQRTVSMFKERTVLMVTHSEIALTGMDRIIRLEQGRVAAGGGSPGAPSAREDKAEQ